MQDRFKFRVYFKGSEYADAGYEDLTRTDVIYSLRADGQVIRTVVYECQQEEHEESPCYMPFTPDNDLYDIQFCTGLKDKNGKLIYEGDIVKVCDYNGLGYFRERIGEVIYGCYSYPAFVIETTLGDVKDFTDDMEVIGNIYENPELLEAQNDNRD